MEPLMRIQKRFLFFFLALIPLAVLIASLGRVFPSVGLNTKENHRQKNILAMSEIYYRQTFNNCAPYSAMAAINIITKKEIDPELLAKETGWRIKNNLTMPQGLIQVLHKHGIKTKEAVLSCCSDNEKINWIKNTVDEGKPIILLIKIKKVLHYVTVIGYDEKGFILYDSLQEKTKSNPRKTIKDKPQYYGNRYYEYSGLIKLWDKGGYKIFFKNWALVCG